MHLPIEMAEELLPGPNSHWKKHTLKRRIAPPEGRKQEAIESRARRHLVIVRYLEMQPFR